jgi:uncharacterized protein YjbJ (UPF0337 family)
MTNDILEGNWKQLRGRVKEAWGNLTDNELNQIEGRRDRLAGKLQEKYGYSRMEAEQEINNFIEGLDDDWDDDDIL